MTLHPDIQKKAQAELDRVMGKNRLPDFNDRADLPYINALVKETMRWNLVLPLGTFLKPIFPARIHKQYGIAAPPHSVTADDEYDGYFIPKGTIVIGNSW